jgi:hypothetical protein
LFLTEHALFIIKYLIGMLFSNTNVEEYTILERINGKLLDQYMDEKKVIEDEKKQ